jgi:hypothetical protein
MRANIDADIFTYSYGSCTDDFGRPLAWPLVATRLNAQIADVVESSGADRYQLYLTDGPSNFRIDVATILPYKGNRPSEKPYWYQQVRSYLEKFRNAKICYGWEADDQLAMDQTEDTIACHLDKDIDMVVGEHFNWNSGKVYTVSLLDGLRNFYSQLATGDKSVDNILGLFGVGKSSKLVKRVREYSTEIEMLGTVYDAYVQRYGRYAWPFLIENAQLLWMVTEERCDPKNQIVERLEALRPHLTGLSWRNELLSSLPS